jgi:hypothetical protein
MSTPSELSDVTKKSKASGRSKKLFNANGKDSAKVTDKDRTNPSSRPNQYAKVKNTVKGEEEIQDDLVHELPEDAVNFANI